MAKEKEKKTPAVTLSQQIVKPRAFPAYARRVLRKLGRF